MNALKNKTKKRGAVELESQRQFLAQNKRLSENSKNGNSVETSAPKKRHRKGA